MDTTPASAPAPPALPEEQRPVSMDEVTLDSLHLLDGPVTGVELSEEAVEEYVVLTEAADTSSPDASAPEASVDTESSEKGESVTVNAVLVHVDVPQPPEGQEDVEIVAEVPRASTPDSTPRKKGKRGRKGKKVLAAAFQEAVEPALPPPASKSNKKKDKKAKAPKGKEIEEVKGSPEPEVSSVLPPSEASKKVNSDPVVEKGKEKGAEPSSEGSTPKSAPPSTGSEAALPNDSALLGQVVQKKTRSVSRQEALNAAQSMKTLPADHPQMLQKTVAPSSPAATVQELGKLSLGDKTPVPDTVPMEQDTVSEPPPLYVVEDWAASTEKEMAEKAATEKKSQVPPEEPMELEPGEISSEESEENPAGSSTPKGTPPPGLVSGSPGSDAGVGGQESPEKKSKGAHYVPLVTPEEQHLKDLEEAHNILLDVQENWSHVLGDWDLVQIHEALIDTVRQAKGYGYRIREALRSCGPEHASGLGDRIFAYADEPPPGPLTG